MKRLFFILLFLYFFFSAHLFSQGNPFFKPQKANKKIASEKVIKKPVVSFSMYQKLLMRLNRYQHHLNKKLSAFSRKIKKGLSIKLLFYSFLLAVLYGIIHALGPGHGKIFAISYFASQKSEWKKGILLGVIIAFLHVISAVALVLCLYFIFKKSLLTRMNDFEQQLKLVSFSLITLIGMVLIFLNLKKKPVETNVEVSNKSIYSIAVGVGLVPCPNTTIILLFSISLNILWYGLFLAFGLAVGMAITISTTGVLTVLVKNRSIGFLSKNSGLKHFFDNYLELIGSFFITGVGLFLLITTCML
ncbi:hypothetical protein KAJ27_03630 [bacterium]|nr:hypothetical protein [bacterium]